MPLQLMSQTFETFETPPPAPPWNLRGGALIFLQRASTRERSARAAFAEVWPSQLPRVLALVHYVESPVGIYDERAIAALTWRGPSVVEMQVSSELSRRGGRENWGYPKTLARLSWREYSRDQSAPSNCQVDSAMRWCLRVNSRLCRLRRARRPAPTQSQIFTVASAQADASLRSKAEPRVHSQAPHRGDVSRIEFRAANKTYRARVLAPSLPFCLRAFTVQNLNGRAVRVPIALRGKLRLAFCGKRAAIFAEFSMAVEAPRAL